MGERPWQQGSVVVEFVWHHFVARLRKPHARHTDLGDMYCTSRVTAHIFLKFRCHGNRGHPGLNLNDAIKLAICHFLLVSHCNRVSIFNRFRDIRPPKPVRAHALRDRKKERKTQIASVYILFHKMGHFNFWLSLSLSESLRESLNLSLKFGLRPKFNLTLVWLLLS